MKLKGSSKNSFSMKLAVTHRNTISLKMANNGHLRGSFNLRLPTGPFHCMELVTFRSGPCLVSLDFMTANQFLGKPLKSNEAPCPIFGVLLSVR